MILQKIKYSVYFICFKVKGIFNKKHKKPLLAGMKITTRCNMQCLHCPFWRKDMKVDMKWDVYKKTIKKIYDEGVRIFIIEGGEPMLWQDKKSKKNITDAIEYAKKYFFYTAISTNGSISFDKINPDIIFVSIESSGENYFKIRGDYLTHVIKNIKAAAEKKIIINITISKLNKDDVIDTIKEFNNIVYGFTLQFFYPYEGLEDFKLTLDERKKILSNIIILKKQGFKILDSYNALTRMANNSWLCNDYLVANIETDGRINYGCYLKDRAENISCKDCGFFAHCELYLAYQLKLGALLTAKKIFMD